MIPPHSSILQYSLSALVSKAMGVTGPDDVVRPGMKTFSDDVFKIELSGPDRENLGIIDIPGIFRNPTPDVTTEADIALVENMVRHYIKDRRTIILAVVPANVDIATQEILGVSLLSNLLDWKATDEYV